MTTVASRDLRNHTAEVLRTVASGTDVTVTVNGVPVAMITQPPAVRRTSMPRAEFLAFLDSRQSDETFAADMAWISEGDTDDLGPIR